jgi:oligosaccharyl transferase (archaeosortase A-associated)
MNRGNRSETAELLAVVFLGVLLRLFAGRPSLVDSGVLFASYDDYYHMRRILYTVGHFPNTLWFDSYIDYPSGLNLTWPPLFDQISAGLSLALGQHAQPGIEMVSAFVPVLLGAVTIAVVYYMVRESLGRNVALMSALMAAITHYHIMNTTIGSTDHHSLEVLLLLSSLLFLVLALSKSEKTYFFAAISGIMMAGLAYTWLGADIYLGIFLAYAALQMTLDLRNGLPSGKTATAITAAFGVALILVLPFWNAPWLFPSFFGIAAAIVGTLVMFALSRFMLEHRVNWIAFPLALLVLAAAFVLFSPLMGMGSLILSGGDYLLGGGMSGKISEAQPLFSSETRVLFSISSYSSSGWKLILNLLFTLAGIAAFILYLRRQEGESKRINGQLLVLVWAVASLILTLGQIRFFYISSIAMGVLISLLFFCILNYSKNRMPEKGQHHFRAFSVALFVLLVLPTATHTAAFVGGAPMIAGDWYESLNWLAKNSNSTSFYDDPVNPPEYSVMSLWDYGNWIIYQAKRPVVANNFQAGIRDSTKFYLSESEAESTALMDERRAKYVFVDYDMLHGKLPSIANWANEDPASYLILKDYSLNAVAIPTQKLFNTTMARLYLFDGAGTGHFRLIYESSTLVGSGGAPMGTVKIFEYVPSALIKVKAGPDERVGALLNMTSNQGRAFTYINEGQFLNGSYEMRVPYSTESRYGTHALGTYLIFSGNEMGVRMQNINVSERDVSEGRTLEVSF